MAVTSMWVVKASLAAPLEYITQDSKTVRSSPAAADYSDQDLGAFRDIMDFQWQEKQRSDLENVLGYVAQGQKTDEEKFVTGINCMDVTAREEMHLVKKQWNKEGGNLCIHCYQSFRPGEVTPELAHNLGIELARSLWGERFQVVVATHLDQQHIHNHFVINSVSFADGKRFHYGQEAYDLMRITSDRLCKEYGLSVIERPQRGRQVNPAAYEKAGMEKRPAYHALIKKDIDDAIHSSTSMDEFYQVLRQKGYTFRPGNVKYFALKPPGKERFTRIEKWYGEDYSLTGIERRIRSGETALPESVWDNTWTPEAPRTGQRTAKPKVYKVRGNWKKAPQRRSRFQRLYLYYCYQLGLFPKQRSRRSYVSKNEVRKMRNIAQETRLLITNKIETLDQLQAYQATQQAQIDLLAAQRKPLYNQLRYAPPDDRATIQAQIDSLTAQLKPLREQIYLCKDITLRSLREAQREEALQLQVAAEQNAKEENENESITGCSQYDDDRDHAAAHRRNTNAADLEW